MFKDKMFMGTATSKTTEILVLESFRLYDNCNIDKKAVHKLIWLLKSRQPLNSCISLKSSYCRIYTLSWLLSH